MLQERQVLAMSVQSTTKKLDTDIFTDWIKHLNRRFLVQNRKVAFTLPGLAGIDLIFLPPNTTSVTKPMDQGVIRSLKLNTIPK